MSKRYQVFYISKGVKKVALAVGHGWPVSDVASLNNWGGFDNDRTWLTIEKVRKVVSHINRDPRGVYSSGCENIKVVEVTV